MSRTKGLSNVTCVRQPFEDVQLSKLYDIVIIYGTLMYVPTDEGAHAFLSKAAKALRKNGFLVLGEAVARKYKYMADWEETSKDSFLESRLAGYRYWEVLRTATFYRDACRSNHLSLLAEFESHAPLFGKTTAWRVIRSLNWQSILAYNKACRNLYGTLKWLFDIRRMRMSIWNRRDLRGCPETKS